MTLKKMEKKRTNKSLNLEVQAQLSKIMVWMMIVILIQKPPILCAQKKSLKSGSKPSNKTILGKSQKIANSRLTQLAPLAYLKSAKKTTSLALLIH